MNTLSTVSIGIDVSKKTLAIAHMKDDRSMLHESITNDATGITAFMQSLTASFVDPRVPIVIESTGDFHMQSALLLREGGRSVKLINPLISKQLEKRDVRGTKTDKVDAERLAKLGATETLANFTATRGDILARKYAGTIAKMRRTIQELSAHVRRSEETATILGLPMDLSHIQNAIDELKSQVTVCEAALAERIHPRLKALAEETRGVSEKQMAVLSVFLSGKTFVNRNQLVAFVGLDVRTRESGEWRGKSRISKRGNSFLRCTLFYIGWGLARYHPTYQRLYADKKKKGAHHYTCILVCARKFLRTIFKELYGRGTTSALSTGVVTKNVDVMS